MRTLWLHVVLLAAVAQYHGASAQLPPGILAEYLFDGSFTNSTGLPTPGLEAAEIRFTADRNGLPSAALLAPHIGLVGSKETDYFKNRRSWTWSGWIRADTFSVDAPATFYSEGNSGASAIVGELKGRLYVQLWNELTPGGWTSLSSSAGLTAGKWTHVAVTLHTADGSNTGHCTIYQDGMVYASGAMPYVRVGVPRANSRQFGFGLNVGYFVGGQTAFPYPFKGAIDEVRIFDSALSAGEIAGLAGQADRLTATAAVELHFPTVVGEAYLLQWSHDLSAWNDHGATIIGNGAEYSTFVSTRSHANRYWRLTRAF